MGVMEKIRGIWRRKPEHPKVQPIEVVNAPHQEDDTGLASGFDESGIWRQDMASRYPALNIGCRVWPIEKIMESQSELIGRILKAFGNDLHGQLLARSAIRRLAETVTTLPATPDEIFAKEGGLFRYALEIGFFSMQGMGGLAIASNEPAAVRGQITKKWALAAFIAGISIELDRVVSLARVTTRDGDVWDPYMHTMHQWLELMKAERYYIHWLSRREQEKAGNSYKVTGYGAQLISDEVRQHLNKDSNYIYGAVISTVTTGNTLADNAFAKLIGRVQLKVAEHDRVVNRSLGGPIVGSHLQPYLLDAMRVLVREGRWGVNTKGGRVWIARQGVFVAWGARAAKDIGDVLQEYPGIPRDHLTIGEIMHASGAFLEAESGKWLWEIMPAGVATSFDAIALRDKALLFSDMDERDVLEVKIIHTDTGKSDRQLADKPVRHDLAGGKDNGDAQDKLATHVQQKPPRQPAGGKSQPAEAAVSTNPAEIVHERKLDRAVDDGSGELASHGLVEPPVWGEYESHPEDAPSYGLEGGREAMSPSNGNVERVAIESRLQPDEQRTEHDVEVSAHEVYPRGLDDESGARRPGIESGPHDGAKQRRERKSKDGNKGRQEKGKPNPDVYITQKGDGGQDERVVNIDTLLGRMMSTFVRERAQAFKAGQFAGELVDGGLIVNVSDLGRGSISGESVASKLLVKGLLAAGDGRPVGMFSGEDGNEKVMLSNPLLKAAGFVG